MLDYIFSLGGFIFIVTAVLLSMLFIAPIMIWSHLRRLNETAEKILAKLDAHTETVAPEQPKRVRDARSPAAGNKCPRCKADIDLSSVRIGEEVKCWECGQALLIE